MTIVRRIAETARDAGERTAIEQDDRSIDFRSLDARAERGAATLAAAGVGAGDRVLISASPSFEFVVAWLAALKLRAIVLPVNPAYRAHELDFIRADATPRAIVTDHSALPGIAIAEFAADAMGPAKIARDPPQPDDPALLVYTSGTTGRPKGALHAHRSLLANADALIARWRITQADRFLHALPLFHVHGLCVALHTALLSRATTVLLPRFDAAAALDAFERRAITVFMGVPTMHARLVDADGDRPRALPRLRLCVSGSAPLPPGLADRFARSFGRELIERYGMTETLITLARAPDDSAPRGSVGTAVEGVEARLAADGELLVRGDSLFLGYRNAPEFTRAAFVDGWFATGDVARRDARGAFTLIGRKRDFVNSGGLKIAPIEVEEALLTLDEVAEACVVGVPDDDLGEAVAAAVVPRAGAHVDADAVMDHCRARIAAFKRPRRVVVVAALPRNAMGKIVKDEVRALFSR